MLAGIASVSNSVLICLSVCLFVYLSVYLYAYPCIHVCLQIFTAPNGCSGRATRLQVYAVYFPVPCVGVTNMSTHYNLSPLWRLYHWHRFMRAPVKTTMELCHWKFNDDLCDFSWWNQLVMRRQTVYWRRTS